MGFDDDCYGAGLFGVELSGILTLKSARSVCVQLTLLFI